MAKKKNGGERKTLPVRIDAHVVRRALILAKDDGVPLSDLVTDALRAYVDRRWPKMLRKLAQDEKEDV